MKEALERLADRLNKLHGEAPTVVVFRVWKWNDRDSVLALFPHEPAVDPSMPGVALCSSYEHIGQHGEASYTGCIRHSRPATETEAAPLKAELESLGYTLKVQRRR